MKLKAMTCSVFLSMLQCLPMRGMNICIDGDDKDNFVSIMATLLIMILLSNGIDKVLNVLMIKVVIRIVMTTIITTI